MVYFNSFQSVLMCRNVCHHKGDFIDFFVNEKFSFKVRYSFDYKKEEKQWIFNIKWKLIFFKLYKKLRKKNVVSQFEVDTCFSSCSNCWNNISLHICIFKKYSLNSSQSGGPHIRKRLTLLFNIQTLKRAEIITY